MLRGCVPRTIPPLGGRVGGRHQSARIVTADGLSIGVVTHSTAANSPAAMRVLVYSDNAETRRRVKFALGKRPHPDLPDMEYIEIATQAALIQQVDAGTIDLAILDGEAAPAGGMGSARQLKDEVDSCPPILVLTSRADDAWLVRWSGAEGSVPHPIDPIRMAAAAIPLLRTRLLA